MPLLQEAQRLVQEFDFEADNVRRGVDVFVDEMAKGLHGNDASISQIPSFVTGVPDGTEKGQYLAIDLGGTNLRVCSVQLHGDSTFNITQMKNAISPEIMTAASSKELFAFLAKQIERFLETHHVDRLKSFRSQGLLNSRTTENPLEFYQLGFTFSFPVNQTSIDRGTLLRWTKGFDIDDTIGQDVCELLQREIDALKLPVKVAALVNDTVGTLMARSYTSPNKTGSLLGAIFGTGTNGAYVERVARIAKLSNGQARESIQDSDIMIVNTEWGSFDNSLTVLPNTRYDQATDANSLNRGVQMFEKRISGMFLGEIFRHAVLRLANSPSARLFGTVDRDIDSAVQGKQQSLPASLHKPWAVDTSLLSRIQGDKSPQGDKTRYLLARELGINSPSSEDIDVVRMLVTAIGRRSARLSAVAIAAVIISTGNHEYKVDESFNQSEEAQIIDIGVDGSLIECYPGFEVYLREALREVPEIGPEGEQRTHIGIAKDGSGVGAALVALVAAKARAKQ